jgi:hypothetical protein
MSHARNRVLAVLAALVALASPVVLAAAEDHSSQTPVAGICCKML